MSNKVTIAQCKRAVTACVTSGVKKFRPLLQGAPGVAKTAATEQIADAIGYKLVTIVLSQMTPEHITGYPYLENGVMKYARPAWWPTEARIMLFFDEIGQCPIAVQNVAMQIIHERRVGPHVLPDDTIVIAAGNRAEDRAGSTVMQTALRTRFFPVFEVEPSKDEWVEFATENEFNPLVIAWAKSQLTKVLDFDPSTKGGFLSPRTLEQAGHCMTVYNNDPDNPDLTAALYGVLGRDSASALLAWVKTVAELPSYDEIVHAPYVASMKPDMIDPIGNMIRANVKFGDLSKVAEYIDRYGPEEQAKLVSMLPDACYQHPDIKELAETLKLDI